MKFTVASGNDSTAGACLWLVYVAADYCFTFLIGNLRSVSHQMEKLWLSKETNYLDDDFISILICSLIKSYFFIDTITSSYTQVFFFVYTIIRTTVPNHHPHIRTHSPNPNEEAPKHRTKRNTRNKNESDWKKKITIPPSYPKPNAPKYR